MNYDYVNVRGHIEVFDSHGNFVLSADTREEAQRELESMLVVKS